MPRSHPPYPAEYRRRLIELERAAGRVLHELINQSIRRSRSTLERARHKSEVASFKLTVPQDCERQCNSDPGSGATPRSGAEFN
jgi:hypothetical protein